MTDEAALLAAIRRSPDDDAPRLVYADWLDEHGQPERAEFIRAQCELARHESPALRRREAELLAAHHDALAGPLAAPHLRFRFERGFIAGLGHTGVFGWRERTSTAGEPPQLTGWFVSFDSIRPAKSSRPLPNSIRSLRHLSTSETLGITLSRRTRSKRFRSLRSCSFPMGLSPDEWTTVAS